MTQQFLADIQAQLGIPEARRLTMRLGPDVNDPTAEAWSQELYNYVTTHTYQENIKKRATLATKLTNATKIIQGFEKTVPTKQALLHGTLQLETAWRDFQFFAKQVGNRLPEEFEDKDKLNQEQEAADQYIQEYHKKRSDSHDLLLKIAEIMVAARSQTSEGDHESAKDDAAPRTLLFPDFHWRTDTPARTMPTHAHSNPTWGNLTWDLTGYPDHDQSHAFLDISTAYGTVGGGERTAAMPSMAGPDGAKGKAEKGGICSGGETEAQREDSSVMAMFAQSVASSYNITQAVPMSFSGKEYLQFEGLWERADTQMKTLGFSPASRFYQLKKVLSGAPLAYVEHLPAGVDDSYFQACVLLHTLYSPKRMDLRSVIGQLINMKPCDKAGSTAERERVHAALVAYRQTLRAMRASNQEVLFQFELAAIEPKLDETWRKEWIKYYSRKQIEGEKIEYQDLVSKLHLVLTEQERQKIARVAFRESAPNVPSKKGGMHLTNAKSAANGPKGPAAAKAKGAPSQSPQGKEKEASTGPIKKNDAAQKRTTQVQIMCPICEIGGEGRQRYLHAFPIQCPLISKDAVYDRDQIAKVIRDKRLCRNCFGHSENLRCEAPDRVRCPVCHERHHIIFHPFEEPWQQGKRNDR